MLAIPFGVTLSTTAATVLAAFIFAAVGLGGREARQITADGQAAFSPCRSPLPVAEAGVTPGLPMKNNLSELEVIGSTTVDRLEIMFGGRKPQVRLVKLSIWLLNRSPEAENVNVSNTLQLGHPGHPDAFRLMKGVPGPMALDFDPEQSREVPLEYVLSPSAPSVEDGSVTDVIVETFLGSRNAPLPKPKATPNPRDRLSTWLDNHDELRSVARVEQLAFDKELGLTMLHGQHL